jgi:hypothetical protein
MDDRPSFRCRRDTLRFLGAIFIPWLLIGVSIVPQLMCLALTGMGANVKPLVAAAQIWFYLFGIAAVIAILVLFLIGIWRIFWYRVYRSTIYGWAWPMARGHVD